MKMDLLKSTDCLQAMESTQTDMEHPTQLVDKAVSTEDLRFSTRNVNLDVVRLEAVLNTLVENKVEAMKNDKKSSSSQSTPMAWNKRMRITSTSTASSSHKEGNHHDPHNRSRHCHKTRIRSDDYEQIKRKETGTKQNGRGHRVASNSPDSPRCRVPVIAGPGNGSPMRIASERPVVACCDDQTQSDDDDDYDDYVQYPPVIHPADSRYMDTCHRSRCSCPHDNHNGQIKSLQYDDDYVSINMDDYENVEEDAIITHDALRRARRKRRKRRKRKKRRHHQAIVIPSVEKVKIVDPDDLPQRARWTIVATACLLLLMCLLLVGVTLRMAPIIDDMVRRENEELINSLGAGGFNSSTSNNNNHVGITPRP